MKNSRSTSYIMYISSMLIFGTIGIFRRFIPLSSGILACVRGLIGAIFLLTFIKIKKRKFYHNIGIKNLLLLILTGAFLGTCWILLFESYNFASLPTATLCFYMQPTIVISLSPIVFGEKLNLKKVISVIVSIIGMAFVSGIFDKTNQGTELKGILFGLGAAVLYATIVIFSKKIQIEDAYEKTIIQLLSSTVVLIPYLLLTEDFSKINITVFGVVMVLIVGIIHTGFAYAMYFSSMDKLSAQSVAILSYIDPVSALIFSAVAINEAPTAWGILGAVLIIGSAVVCEMANKK